MKRGNHPLAQPLSLDQLVARSFGALSGLLGAALLATALIGFLLLDVVQPSLNRYIAAQRAVGLASVGMLDQETGLRGWLMTADDRFLDPYYAGQAEVRRDDIALEQLIGDDPVASAAFHASRAAEQAWVTQWANHAQDRVAGLGGVSAEGSFLAAGKTLFDQYRLQAGRLGGDVDSAIRRAEDEAAIALGAGIGADLVLLSLAIALGRRQQRRLQAAVVEPVAGLIAAIDSVSRGDLAVEAPQLGPVELRNLGHRLTEMIGSLTTERELRTQRESELSVQASDLRQAQLQAEEGSRAKSEFLSRVSHELRTPLTAVLGFAELLASDELAASQRESVEIITKSGNHLLALINDVLDISRIEAGEMALSLERLNVSEVTSEVLELARPLAAGRKIHITVAVPDEPIYAIKADHHRFKQVLLNLVSNAIKFNHEGGSVAVSVHLRANDIVRVSVVDTGPGMRESDLHRLFSPFERLDATTRGVEGTGLGLTLSKCLIEAMGGSLTFTTAPGAGSTFSVDIPRDADGAPIDCGATGLPTVPGEGVRAYRAGRRVLYVEDTLSNIRLVERIFDRRPGVALMTAMQGRIALDLAREHRPDLVLLDLHLPDMDGRDVLADLRAHPATCDIPVIVVSADATSHQIQRLRSAGARGYLTKPIRIHEFLAAVDGVLA